MVADKPPAPTENNEELQRQISNELDDQAKHIEKFIQEMESKIVGGNGPGPSPSTTDLLTESTPTPALDRLSFKAKREKNKMLKN